MPNLSPSQLQNRANRIVDPLATQDCAAKSEKNHQSTSQNLLQALARVKKGISQLAGLEHIERTPQRRRVSLLAHVTKSEQLVDRGLIS